MNEELNTIIESLTNLNKNNKDYNIIKEHLEYCYKKKLEILSKKITNLDINLDIIQDVPTSFNC